MKVCLVEGCDRRVLAKGMCGKHYQQVKKRGRVMQKGASKNEINKIVGLDDETSVMWLYNTWGEKIGDTYFDTEFVDSIRKYRWYLNSLGYVYSNKGGYLHRLLVGVNISSQEVDHIDRDKTNNRIKNLRVTTRKDNGRNLSLSARNTSGFKGVFRKRNAWKAAITVDRKSIYLGTFNSPEDAARAYDEAVAKYHGGFGTNNVALGLYDRVAV